MRMRWLPFSVAPYRKEKEKKRFLSIQHLALRHFVDRRGHSPWYPGIVWLTGKTVLDLSSAVMRC